MNETLKNQTRTQKKRWWCYLVILSILIITPSFVNAKEIRITKFKPYNSNQFKDIEEYATINDENIVFPGVTLYLTKGTGMSIEMDSKTGLALKENLPTLTGAYAVKGKVELDLGVGLRNVDVYFLFLSDQSTCIKIDYPEGKYIAYILQTTTLF